MPSDLSRASKEVWKRLTKSEEHEDITRAYQMSPRLPPIG